MNAATAQIPSSPDIQRRADVLFQQHQHQIYVRTDQLFAALMVLQWLACIVTAYWISPQAWSGTISQTHIHVWAALLLGGTITSLPVLLTFTVPGRAITRHTIAVAQMLTSALLIHLMGGRIEAHFHVFGSLAFLAVYRDWRVLITATVVVAGDHMFRGIFWPQSVYGVLSTSWFRTVEHAAWVVFEDVILIRTIYQSTSEMREIAVRRAELEMTNVRVEQLVTERTAELRASEERARTIVNMSSDAFVAMNGEGQIVEWNREAERTFGYTREEVLGKSLAETLIPSHLRQAHYAGLKQFLLTGDGPVLNRRIEISALKRSGDEFPVELTITAIPIEDSWLFTAFARDITVRQRDELELKQTKEAAEAANRAKSEFLANMSHEIRTPLNGIVGMAELALETQLSYGQLEYLNTIKSCADSLLSIINDILDFSKIEAGKLDMDRCGFHLPDLLSDTCKTLGFRADQKGLELACRIGPDVPEYVMGDAGRLRQVVINLVGNAIKFTKQGEIVVQAELVSRTDTSVELKLVVSDTGIGIPKEKQCQIFQAFEQADSSITRTYGGTGLGLAISSKIVALMNGKLELESQQGSGSTFYFTVHFDLAPEQERHVSRPTASLRDLRVLVVDDNQTNLRILTEILHHWHMQPTAVAGGKEALAALEQAAERGRPYALVLLDAQMPEMDGFTLIEHIKANRRLKETVLMMLSSAAQHSDAERCRNLGVAAYLTKPIKQSELLDTILLLLNPTEHIHDEGNLVSPQSVRGTVGNTSAKWNILLAEDNPVNQRVASGILEKRGHTVTAVENGLEALQAVKVQRFDLVLMDLQMPEMDGFAATAAIRDLEQPTGRHLPIVAMTARAMKGDRECCLQAGMDGYVSKPINPKELLATIENLVCRPVIDGQQLVNSDPKTMNHINNSSKQQPIIQPVPTSESLAASAETNSDDLAVIDFAALLARVENDTTLLDEMIELYLDSSPRLLIEIETGVRMGDPVTVQRAAHALKGALQNLSAGPCALAALELEKQGRSGDIGSVDGALVELKTELARLQSELSSRPKGVEI
jgi:two-component system, sensor histidine kinase and response regulator